MEALATLDDQFAPAINLVPDLVENLINDELSDFKKKPGVDSYAVTQLALSCLATIESSDGATSTLIPKSIRKITRDRFLLSLKSDDEIETFLEKKLLEHADDEVENESKECQWVREYLAGDDLAQSTMQLLARVQPDLNFQSKEEMTQVLTDFFSRALVENQQLIGAIATSAKKGAAQGQLWQRSMVVNQKIEILAHKERTLHLQSLLTDRFPGLKSVILNNVDAEKCLISLSKFEWSVTVSNGKLDKTVSGKFSL